MSVEDKFLPTKTDLKFATEQEPWSVWRLEDGTIIKARVMLVDVKDSGCKTPDGKPYYELNLMQAMNAEFPDDVIAAAKDRPVKE